MIDTRLIILEGMPGTGKTTNSSFLYDQLHRNNINARWIHEVTRMHPTSYYMEACLELPEYEAFIIKYPEIRGILEANGIKRGNTMNFDLLELKWKYEQDITIEAFKELENYDVWNCSLEKYEEIALEKWRVFVAEALKKSEEVMILDSSIFQYQIFWFLGKNATYGRLEEFVESLFKIIEPLNPVLIYLYRESIEETIAFLEKERGEEYLEYIWERDKNEPFYKRRPKGAEGHREFLRYYGNWANNLFTNSYCRKKSIEISENQWRLYEEEILSFLGLQRKAEIAGENFEGTFVSRENGIELKIDGYNLVDPRDNKRRLIPRGEDSFHVNGLPTVIRFITQDKFVIEGEQILERWTSTGSVYCRK